MGKFTDHLIDDCKKFHKMATVRFWLVVGIAAQFADVLPSTLREMLPQSAANIISSIAAVSLFLRLYKQKGLSKDAPAANPNLEGNRIDS